MRTHRDKHTELEQLRVRERERRIQSRIERGKKKQE